MRTLINPHATLSSDGSVQSGIGLRQFDTSVFPFDTGAVHAGPGILAPAHHTSPVRTHACLQASSPTDSSFCLLPPACPLPKLQSIVLIMGLLALPILRSACPLRRDDVSHTRSITPHAAATASTPAPTPTFTSPLARVDSTSFARDASMHATDVCRTTPLAAPSPAGLHSSRLGTRRREAIPAADARLRVLARPPRSPPLGVSGTPITRARPSTPIVCAHPDNPSSAATRRESPRDPNSVESRRPSVSWCPPCCALVLPSHNMLTPHALPRTCRRVVCRGPHACSTLLCPPLQHLSLTLVVWRTH